MQINATCMNTIHTASAALIFLQSDSVLFTWIRFDLALTFDWDEPMKKMLAISAKLKGWRVAR